EVKNSEPMKNVIPSATGPTQLEYGGKAPRGEQLHPTMNNDAIPPPGFLPPLQSGQRESRPPPPPPPPPHQALPPPLPPPYAPPPSHTPMTMMRSPFGLSQHSPDEPAAD